MCSTFKAMAAAAVLKRVDAGQEHLDRFVRYGRGRPAQLRAGDQGARRRRRHETGRSLRGRRRAQRQHRRQPDPRLARRPAGWTRFVALARRRQEPARPQRAGAEHRHPRRSARHHDAAGDGRPISRPTCWARRSCRRLPRSASGLDDRGARPAWPGCAPGCPPAGRSATRPAPEATARPTTSPSPGPPTGPIVIACYLTGAEAAARRPESAPSPMSAASVASSPRPCRAGHG